MKKGWDVMCNIDKIAIDVTNKVGYLYLPENNIPDMKSTIECFTSVDPECSVIWTVINGEPDTVYIKNGDTWESKSGPRE